MNARCVALLLILTLAGVAGCGDSPTGPAAAAPERITLEVSATAIEGSPGHPVTVEPVAANLGRTTVNTFYDCAAPYLPIEWLGPAGEPVNVLDPHRMRPLCAGWFGAFDPGAKIADAQVFDGTLYTDQGESYPAPAGIYTAVARFGYSRPAMPWQEQVVLERPIAIFWRSN